MEEDNTEQESDVEKSEQQDIEKLPDNIQGFYDVLFQWARELRLTKKL